MNKLPLVVIVVASLGACKKSVKNEDVEAFIKKRTEELGLAGAKVGCPKGVEAKVGNKFDCTVELEGKTYLLTATVTSVDGSKLNIDTAWKDGAAVISSKMNTGIGQELSNQFGTPVQVACGEPLRFLDKDRNVTCDLTAGATKAKVVVTFDESLTPTKWKLDPQLLSKKKLEEILTEPVRAKTSPGVAITCGNEPLISRPADGNVWCQIAEGDKAAKLKVAVDEELAVKNWEVTQ